MNNKDCAYFLVSTVCSVEEYRRVIPSDKYKTSQAVQKYYRIFCDGFVQNGKKINVFSKRPISRKTSENMFIKSKQEKVDGINYNYCSILNIPIIGLLYSFLVAFFWFINPKNCDSCDKVFIDPLNVAIASAVTLACKIRNIKVVYVLTDLPQVYCYSGNAKMSYSLRVSAILQKYADAYVFLTKQMNDIVNIAHKPFIVIEGFVDTKMKDIKISKKYDKFVVLYAGGLDKAYGLDMLVEGFRKADIIDSELHIYGDGKYANEIKSISQTDSRIKYFGVCDNEYVVLEQLKATLLVNPRYSNSEFTKYSFPSKNMEYAVSGTPMLTTLLPGMPEEYQKYVFLLLDETIEGMANILSEIYNTYNRNDLEKLGEITKNFVLEEKNNKIQIRKILNFLTNV